MEGHREPPPSPSTPGWVGLWLVASLVLLAPLDAQDLWVLQSGPDQVDGIPLSPPELVPGWRGSYTNGDEVLWVYVTQSPHFFGAPSIVRTLPDTPWVALVFFPPAWSGSQRHEWFARWRVDFLRLSTLPNPGVPVSFPAVLRKG